jgi:hypothetical protein
MLPRVNDCLSYTGSLAERMRDWGHLHKVRPSSDYMENVHGCLAGF